MIGQLWRSLSDKVLTVPARDMERILAATMRNALGRGSFLQSISTTLPASTTTMLANTSRTAVRRSARAIVSRSARRTLVTPSSADRASVVDLPSTFQDDGHFTPRSGMLTVLMHNGITHFGLLTFRHVWIQGRGSQA